MLSLTLLFSLVLTLQDQADFLSELVEINSGTQNISGVNRVQKIIAEKLIALGFEIQKIKNQEKKTAELVIAVKKGKNPEHITLIAHADTVFEKNSEFQKFKTLANNLAKGPGVIDDKGGLVVLIQGLRIFLEKNPELNWSIQVIISPNEEAGSTGFHDEFKRRSENSKIVLGLEPALNDGDIIDARRGNRWYQIEVRGREAHAGRAHADGINACDELSIKAHKLQKLTDYAKDITVSIGHVIGGQDKFNIVCGSATAKIDVRFSDLKSRDRLHEQIKKIIETPYVKAASDGKTSSAAFELADDCPPFSQEPRSKHFADLYLKELHKIEGKKYQVKKSGGAADTNYFARPGLVILDGLGAVGKAMHTEMETIELKSLDTRAKALAQFLSLLQKEDKF